MERRGTDGDARRGGFTLVELLVVIGIMIVLGGLVLGAIDVATKYAEVGAVKGLINNMAAANVAYRSDFGVYVDDQNGYGNRELYRKLSGDLDGDGSVTDDDAPQYYSFTEQEVVSPASATPIIDAMGFIIGYDRTFDEVSKASDVDVQQSIGTEDPRGDPPEAKNIRSFDLFARGADRQWGTTDDIFNK
jgi:type II secretory pathway pseudopilin PulG